MISFEDRRYWLRSMTEYSGALQIVSIPWSGWWVYVYKCKNRPFKERKRKTSPGRILGRRGCIQSILNVSKSKNCYHSRTCSTLRWSSISKETFPMPLTFLLYSWNTRHIKFFSISIIWIHLEARWFGKHVLKFLEGWFFKNKKQNPFQMHLFF